MGLSLNGKQPGLSGDEVNAISFILNNFAFLDMVYACRINFTLTLTDSMISMVTLKLALLSLLR